MNSQTELAQQHPLLCEVAWEVCQQVGGIYTVIRSKVPAMLDHWSGRYLLIGPYNPESASAEFEELDLSGPFAPAIEALRNQGVGAHYGRWLIPGRPCVLLLDFNSIRHQLDYVRYILWENHCISCREGNWLLDDVLLFGHLVERFFRVLCELRAPECPLVGHFHEWMGAGAIPEIRRARLPLTIVFTTHATSLGRYLAMNDPWFYDHVPFVDWLKDARRFNVEAQVMLERSAAHGAHVFSTVSEITAYECRSIIGRNPDVLLPNGLNIERFVAMHEFQNLHSINKEKIHQFVIGHFFANHCFDLDRTLYFFTSGRYEFRNKGFDLTINAMARLNSRLKNEGADITIVFFITSKRPFRSMNPEALQSRGVMEEIRKSVRQVRDQVDQRLFMSTVMNTPHTLDELVDDDLRLNLRRLRQSWRLTRYPVVVTHDLVDDSNDEVLNMIRQYDLVNKPEDRVKVVYYPDFINAASPLLPMDYDQFARACHLGVFPSYYEPWGYTPEECLALGTPAITSDLSGFGAYALHNMPTPAEQGLYIIPRRYVSYQESLRELTDVLYDYTQLDRRQRIMLRNKVEASAGQFSWSILITNYLHAYEEARHRVASGHIAA